MIPYAKILRTGSAVAALAVFAVAGAATAAPAEQTQPQQAQDEAGDPAAIPPKSERADKSELLNLLFAQLKDTDNEGSAALIQKGIWKLWIDSGSPTIDLAMGRVGQALESKDLPLALDLLNGVVKVKPDYAEGWNKRATVLYMLKDYTHSIQDIERTLALEPRHFGALAGLGMIFLELDNKAAALKAFRRALAVNPYLTSAKRQVKTLSREVEGRGI